MKKFDFQFNVENGVLVKIYFGEITINDIESSWIYAFQNNVIPPNVKGFLLDYRQATFAFPADESTKIAAFYREHPKFFGNKKIAIVVTTPNDVIIPVLVKMEDDGYYSRPFSDYSAAIAWITF
jgi:hypothetical protein